MNQFGHLKDAPGTQYVAGDQITRRDGTVEDFNAYRILDYVVQEIGFAQVNPESLTDLRDNFAAKDRWDCASLVYHGNTVRRAYNKVMADVQAMFAPR